MIFQLQHCFHIYSQLLAFYYMRETTPPIYYFKSIYYQEETDFLKSVVYNSLQSLINLVLKMFQFLPVGALLSWLRSPWTCPHTIFEHVFTFWHNDLVSSHIHSTPALESAIFPSTLSQGGMILESMMSVAGV